MHFSTRDMARLGYLMLREGEWKGREVIPQEWVHKIIALRTPVEEMNPESFREGRFGYGMMWWIWDGKETPEVMRGAYSAAGAFGQFITVIPKLDMVLAHKTAVPPYERQVGGNAYFSLVEGFAPSSSLRDRTLRGRRSGCRPAEGWQGPVGQRAPEPLERAEAEVLQPQRRVPQLHSRRSQR